MPFKVNVGGPKIGDFKKDQYWWKDSDSYGHLNGSLQNSEGIEIKVAPGMIADLYNPPEASKKSTTVSKENKGGLLSGIFGNKK